MDITRDDRLAQARALRTQAATARNVLANQDQEIERLTASLSESRLYREKYAKLAVIYDALAEEQERLAGE